MNIDAFYKLSYGLYAISSYSGDKKNGYIANTAFQITATPSQIAISCNKENLSADFIKSSGLFSISILSQDASSELIGLFGFKSGKEVDKFVNTKHIIGNTGVPIVTEGTIAWFECKVVSTVDVGTHLLFIGEIVNNDLLDGGGVPMTYDYYHKVKKGVAPKNAPTYIDPSKIEKKVAKYPDLKSHQCLVCKYIFDPELGDASNDIAPGTAFEDTPEDWVCPICGATKDLFEEMN